MLVTEAVRGYQEQSAGKLSGGLIGHAMLSAIAHLNLSQEVRVLPWARAYQLALSRENVLIFSIARTKQRESAFIWVKHLASVPTYVFARHDYPNSRVTALDELKGQLLVVKRDDVLHQLMLAEGFSENRNLALVLSNQDAISMLLSQRADVHPISAYNLREECRLLGCKMKDFKRLMELPELQQELYLAASLGTEDKWQVAFRQALDKIMGPKPRRLN